MVTEYIDVNQIPVSNSGEVNKNITQPDLESAGGDFNSVEPAPGFQMRTSEWEEQIPTEDLLLPPAGSAYYATPENVCGNDDRVRINTTDYPYKCIAKLVITGQSGNRWNGTGFLIGPKCIITNGHVVFPDRKWAREIQVIPALNGNSAPFGSQVSRNLWTVNGWADGSGNPDYDYGAIILPDSTLYNRIRASFGYKVFANPGILNNSGYPGDKPTGTQWFNAGPVSRSTAFRFFYMIDTAAGQSGSPVWVNSGGSRIDAGVHAYGGCPNSAIRCNADVAKNWSDWRNK
ncbi:MAG: hypothetical protein M9915_17875 [Rhizobacter sp.]|nr:hypothetical protein [Rhizobacter sp.]